MELRTFIKLSNRAQRERLCTLADTTIGYLRRVAAQACASPFKALQIENATRKISESHELLDVVPGQTLCDADEYQKFLKQLKKVA